MLLPSEERKSLLLELQELSSVEKTSPKFQEYRRKLLDNKQRCCSHCGHTKYVRFGKDKGSQRYKCKSCNRSFTEYSGTWMAGLHKKDKVDSYMQLMLEEKSLDKIKVALKINKKTAFDWRHKILSSVEQTEKGDFTGITESDETFFLHSEKGNPSITRKPRKRGGSSSKQGVNNEHMTVIVTQDRQAQIDLTLATAGRLKKIDIERAVGGRFSAQTVLCTDSHVSYKGFAIDNKIEHHPLRSDLKQRVKEGIYHIQHVNSTHHRVKKWIDEKFWGVSTKYLQQYLNWFRLKEILKQSRQPVKEFAEKTMQDISAYQRFGQLDRRYSELISTQS